MLTEFADLYTKIKAQHEEIYLAVSKLRDRFRVEGDVEVFADGVYAAAECLKFLEDSTKTLKAFKEGLEKITCAIWVKNGQTEAIKTEFCNVTPRLRMMAQIPTKTKDPERYALLMDHLKIPREVWDVGEDAKSPVSIHWPGMMDYISTLIEQGKPLPPGLDKASTYAVYKASVTKQRKEVNAK